MQKQQKTYLFKTKHLFSYYSTCTDVQRGNQAKGQITTTAVLAFISPDLSYVFPFEIIPIVS